MKSFSLSWLFILTFVVSKGQQLSVQPLADWQFKSKGSTTWYKAQVPGTIHTDLLNNQLIPDPFYGTNEQHLQWISDSTWEYQTNITITEEQLQQEQIELVFEGIDTYAKILINNHEVLTADNMFRTWTIDVKPILKVGTNTILVILEPNEVRAKNLAKQLPYTLPGEDRVHIRKAQYHFGWDWGPKFVTCGIWKKVHLQFWSGNKLEHIQVKQLNLQKNTATISVDAQLANNEKTTLLVSIWFDGKLVAEKKVINNASKASALFTLNKPNWWWCNGLGRANVYEARVSILANNKQQQELKTLFGLRSISLVQTPDSLGKSFFFKLNGFPVFAKGANVIPFDVFLTRVARERYETIIKQAAEANMNMIRVWGGGVYERDEFYDLCDKYGIMVWQDFMFACGMYPGDSAFLNNVSAEVTEQVIRLRNHPCIAVWCGNNENMEGWVNWGWQKQYGYTQKDSTQIAQHYDTLFHRIIPNLLSVYDHERAYHPSSPANGWGKAKSLTEGDIHYWGVWWGMQPFSAYQNKVGRFVSEYGFQSMANKTCMETVIPKNEWSLSSSSCKNHQKHPTGYETISQYAQHYFTVPNALDSFTYVSQVTQAIGMETAINAHRSKKPYCMGSLYWQLNDCWPVTSWSTTDYSLQPKAAYYRIKKAFSPLTLISETDSTNIKIIAVSDLAFDTTVEIQVKEFDERGNQLAAYQLPFTFKANSAARLTTIPRFQTNTSVIRFLLYIMFMYTFIM